MAWTHAGLYEESVRTASGSNASNVSVTITVSGTQTLASLYADRNRSTVLPNPVTTDSLGNLLFYTEPGLYTAAANGGTFSLVVPPDPDDVAALGVSASGTVASETSFGVASSAGTAAAYARGDHTHGTPAAPTAASVGADSAGTATSAVSTHAAASDPHGDRADSASKVSSHAAASDPHGDRSFATSAVSTHAAASDPHGDRASAASLYVTLADVPDRSALYPGAARLPRWVQPSAVITTMQSGHGWTGTGTGGVFNLNDTSTFISGSQCATLTTGGAGAQTNLRKFAGSVPDTTGKVFRLRLKIDDTTHLNELDFYYGSSSLANTYKWSFAIAGGSAWITSGDWCTVTLSFADASTSGTPTRSGMTDLQLQAWDDAAGAVTVHLQSVELIPDGSATWPNGVVSICFDDSWSSARDLAFAKLDSYGYPASLFTITDQLGSANHMTVGDIKTRVDRFGWESAAHANTDADHSLTYTGMTAAQLDTDLRAQRAWLIANGIRIGDGTAYPLGQFGRTSDAQSTTDIVRRYCSWARTTANRTRETFPPADPYRIRAISSISTFAGGVTPTSLTTASTGTIDKAKANSAWLILVFHKIVTTAPAATTECAQSDFNAILDKINTAGMPVATIGDVLRYFG